MIYEVSHRTIYRYSVPVSISHHRLHLTPRWNPAQICHRTGLAVSPTPDLHTTAEDYFGNPVAYVTVQDQHVELALHARSVIEVRPQVPPDAALTQPWEWVYPRLADDTSERSLDALQYAFASHATRASGDVRGYALESFTPGRPVLEGAIDLTRRIFQDFAFDPTATTVSTPVDEVFARRRGVCQDFAHLEIACLRALRLPARYVSGYLLTRPPPGQPRLVGADASHAWLAVWCGEHGWVDLDPTNNLVVGDEHITVAWGRDYGDVSPVTGAIYGGGKHTVEVAVDVTPIEAAVRPAPTDEGV